MKKTLILCIAVCSISVAVPVQAQNPAIPESEAQVKAAVSAAPAKMQEGASVLGYDQNGELVTLREGDGELICLADDPSDSRFHVACYYKELEPFMRRGRELRAEGKSRKEVNEIRESEIKSGELDFPKKPMALYSLTGPSDGYNYERGAVTKANSLQVVYVPFATVQTTGLSSSPAGPGAPWLMNPGQPWAHIMIPGNPVGSEDGND